MSSVSNVGDTTMAAITLPRVLLPTLRQVDPLSMDFRTPRPSVPAKTVPSAANAGEAARDHAKPPVGPMASQEPSACTGSGAMRMAARTAATNAATVRVIGRVIMQLSEQTALAHRP